MLTGNFFERSTGTIPAEMEGSPHEASEEVNDIYVINYEHANVYEKEFLGACISSAAQKTVVGKPLAILYNQRSGIPFHFEESRSSPTFTFRTHRHQGLGKMEIRIPIADDHFMMLNVDVVNIDIPFLLGLDTMQMYGMILDTDNRTLSSKFQGWELPLVRKRGHLYYEWDIQILFTETELRKVHKHFFHPKPEKLYALIRRADPEKASPQVLKDLEKIDATCDPCQRFATAPHRFKVSLPSGDVTFNREVCVDLMSLNKRTVLHAVDRDTKFNAARFLKDESAESAWNTFREMWVSTYVGYPDIIAADQGPQFRSKYWRDVTKLAGIHLKLSGVESYNAINVGETYHEFLHRIYHKVSEDDPALSKEDLLVLSTKALNDTAGPHGLVPTLLVFGILPRIPLVPTELPTQVQRMKAMDAARSELTRLVAESKLKLALKSNAPGVASYFDELRIGSKVLVFREKPINKWVGPFTVLNLDGKMCQLDIYGRQAKHSIDKVKLYRSPPEAGTLANLADEPNETLTGLQKSAKTIADNIEHIPSLAQMDTDPRPSAASNSDSPLDDPSVIDRWKLTFQGIRDEESQQDIQELEDLRLQDFNPDQLFKEDVADIHLTKTLSPTDPCGDGDQFDDAKWDEMDGMKKREIWDVVCCDEVPRDSNVSGGRFVLAYKNYDT